MEELDMGVYYFERETPNTKRFSRENENGRKETIYIPKTQLATIGDPEKIQVVVRPA